MLLMESLIVNEACEYEVVSYIDLLFEDPNSEIVGELYFNIVKDRERKQNEVESMANLGRDPPPAPPASGGSPPRSPTIRKLHDSVHGKEATTHRIQALLARLNSHPTGEHHPRSCLRLPQPHPQRSQRMCPCPTSYHDPCRVACISLTVQQLPCVKFCF